MCIHFSIRQERVLQNLQSHQQLWARIFLLNLHFCLMILHCIEIFWKSLKRVLRHLKGFTAYGMCFKCGAKLLLTEYADADWASSVEDRKSIASYAVYFGTNLVSWQSKKQGVVARSSTKLEYRALAQVVTEISWLRSLLTKLQFPLLAKPMV
ncbi:hypothetical protein Scep_017158 [Stephania cephalantha]|uniref:Mitochondrial protein n=1 Tax=Stephania cephalantha TaxID=152367 RepID=A0AAP0NVD5_9MAGN